MERLQEQEKELEMMERLDKEIWDYRDQGNVGQLIKLNEIKIELKLDEMKQRAALPGTLASRLRILARMALVCPSSPRITSLAAPFLASSLLHVKQGRAKKHKCRIFKMAKP